MSVSTVLSALRQPEAFTLDHADRPGHPRPLLRRADRPLFAALTASAALGVGAYGAALHAHAGVGPMLAQGAGAVAAAGGAWMATLPALYVLGTLSGSRLSARTLVLGSLVTVSFGGLAMLASVPVLWFFELALPGPTTRIAVSVLSFLGVGLCMADVFVRVMRTLGALSWLHLAWLTLLGAVGLELFIVLGLFDLT